MCKLFSDWSTQIEKYCIENQLSYQKVAASAKCWGKDDIIFQHYDKNDSSNRGLLDEKPLPIVLKVKKKNGTLWFEQTENTRKYLSL